MKLSQKLASIPNLPVEAIRVIVEHSDWIPNTVTPREGEDLLLKLNIEGHEKITTGYYLKGSFWLDDERFQENSQYITHYQYSKELL